MLKVLPNHLLIIILNKWIDSVFHDNKSNKFMYIYYVLDIMKRLRLLSWTVNRTIVPKLQWNDIELNPDKYEELFRLFGRYEGALKNYRLLKSKLYNKNNYYYNISCLNDDNDKLLSSLGNWSDRVYSISLSDMRHLAVLNVAQLQSLTCTALRPEIADYTWSSLVELQLVVHAPLFDMSSISKVLSNLKSITLNADRNLFLTNLGSLSMIGSLRALKLNRGLFFARDDFLAMVKSSHLEEIDMTGIFDIFADEKYSQSAPYYDVLFDALAENNKLKIFTIKRLIVPCSCKIESIVKCLNRNSTLKQLEIIPTQIQQEAGMCFDPINNSTLTHLKLELETLDLLTRYGRSQLKTIDPLRSQDIYTLLKGGQHPNLAMVTIKDSHDDDPFISKIIKLNVPSLKKLDILPHPRLDCSMISDLSHNSNIESMVLEYPTKDVLDTLFSLNHPTLKKIFIGFVDQEDPLHLLKLLQNDNNNLRDVFFSMKIKKIPSLSAIVDLLSDVFEKNHNIYRFGILANRPEVSPDQNESLWEAALSKFEKSISRNYQHISSVYLNLSMFNPKVEQIKAILIGSSINTF